MGSTGKALEDLVKKSAKALEPEGLRLKQTGARFVGKVGARGRARGRVVESGDLDFVGDFRGFGVSFDAKSTQVNTRFDLKLIKKHQAVIVKRAHARGALAFFLVEFSRLEAGPRYWCLTWPVLRSWWDAFDHDGEPASIPAAVFEAECLEVVRAGNVLDLVAAVRQLLEVAA